MPGQRGISPNQPYTTLGAEIRAELARLGPNAAARYTNKKNIYVETSFKERNGLDSQRAIGIRNKKYAGASDKIKAAINDEYKMWPVGGVKMGDYVFHNLLEGRSSERLSENDLQQIDKLLDDGMKASAVLSTDRARIEMALDREQLFKEARDAGSGDPAAWERAAGWRKIVEGNRMMCDAIEEDLKESGVLGDLTDARDISLAIIRNNGISKSGLTGDAVQKISRHLNSIGIAAGRVAKLAHIIRMDRSLTQVSAQLDNIDTAIAAALGDTKLVTKDYWKNAVGKALNERSSSSTIEEEDNESPLSSTVTDEHEKRPPLSTVIRKFHQRGRLDDEDAAHALIERLKQDAAMILDTETGLRTGPAKNEPANKKLSLLLRQRAIVLQELAISLMPPERRDDFTYISEFKTDGLNAIPALVQTKLPVDHEMSLPETLYKSDSDFFGEVDRHTVSSFKRPLQRYNETLKEVKTRQEALLQTPPDAAEPDITARESSLDAFRHAVDNALVMQRFLRGEFDRLDKIRGAKRMSKYEAQQRKLVSHGETLQTLCVAATSLKALLGASDQWSRMQPDAVSHDESGARPASQTGAQPPRVRAGYDDEQRSPQPARDAATQAQRDAYIGFWADSVFGPGDEAGPDAYARGSGESIFDPPSGNTESAYTQEELAKRLVKNQERHPDRPINKNLNQSAAKRGGFSRGTPGSHDGD